MTGLVRKATLIAACGLLTAATAFANVPSPGNSTVPRIVPVVGTQNGVVHPGKSITVTVNDFLGNPIGGSAVLVDFGGMVDVRLCTAVVAGTGTVNCGASTVLASTNASGQVTLTILGQALNAGGPSKVGHNVGAGTIYADGVPLGNFHSPTILQDENNTIDGNDVVRVLKDKDTYALGGAPEFRGRSDHFPDTTMPFTDELTGQDVSAHLALKDASALGNGSGSGCHDGGSAQPYCP